MHFQNIKSAREIKLGLKAPPKNKKDDPIGRHFTSNGHTGIPDIQISVLEFIKAPSKSPPGQILDKCLETKKKGNGFSVSRPYPHTA
jgi:hypothetical protein